MRSAIYPPPNQKNRKVLLIVLFCLIAIAAALVAVLLALMLGRCSKAEAKTFDFTCSQYTTEMNNILGENKLDENKWVVDKAVSVYTDDDFEIRLTTDTESKKVSDIRVGPYTNEHSVKMAAVSLMVAEPKMEQQPALAQLAELKQKTKTRIINDQSIVELDEEEECFVISYNAKQESTRDEVITAPPATAAPVTVVTAAPETTEETTAAPVRSVDDLVYTELECQINYSGAFQLTGEESGSGSASRDRMPQLTLDSDDAAAVNSEIRSRVESAINNAASGGYVGGRTDYVCYLNGNILSLAIESRSVDTPNSFFLVYNFDVDTGRLLGRDEVVARAGISLQDAQDMVTGEMTALFDDAEGKMSGNSATMLQKQRERTLSQDNLDTVSYFFNGDGALCATYRYYWVAGAENYGQLTVLNAQYQG